MRVTEEIDAMRTIGLGPMQMLVIPRLFALLLTLPALALWTNFMELLGGCLMARSTLAEHLGITIPQFVRQLQSELSDWTYGLA